MSLRDLPWVRDWPSTSTTPSRPYGQLSREERLIYELGLLTYPEEDGVGEYPSLLGTVYELALTLGVLSEVDRQRLHIDERDGMLALLRAAARDEVLWLSSDTARRLDGMVSSVVEAWLRERARAC